MTAWVSEAEKDNRGLKGLFFVYKKALLPSNDGYTPAGPTQIETGMRTSLFPSNRWLVIQSDLKTSD